MDVLKDLTLVGESGDPDLSNDRIWRAAPSSLFMGGSYAPPKMLTDILST